jgi:LysW-gamma-L-lysine carboxypeptidase
MPTACEVAVDYWQRVCQRLAQVNHGRTRPWDQVLAALRSFDATNDGLEQSAHLLLGFRLPPDFGPHALQDLLRAAVEGVEGIELRFWGEEVAYQSDKNNPLVRAFLAAIRHHGGRPGFVLKTGTSDMNIVGPVWQCPIIAYGPGDSTLDHTPDEYIELAEWQQGVAVLTTALDLLLTGA